MKLPYIKRHFSHSNREEKQKIHNQEDYKASLEMENIGSKLIGFHAQQEASEKILLSKPEYFHYSEQGRNKNSHPES